MPIKVSCKCGQSFAAKDEMAGKTVRCPKCKQPLKIPGPGGARRPGPTAAQPHASQPAAPAGGGMDDLFDEIGLAPAEPVTAGPRCPSCGKGLPPHAILCVHCGFNLQTGQRVASSVPSAPAGDAHGGHGGSDAEAMIAKARREIAASPISAEDQDFGEGTSPLAWVLTLCLPLLLGVAVFAIMMWGNYLQWYMAFIGTGFEKGDSGLMCMSCFSIPLTILLMIAWFRITFLALEENVIFGLLCLLLCGIFVPVYGIMRWQKCFAWTITFFVCSLISIPLFIVQFVMFWSYMSNQNSF